MQADQLAQALAFLKRQDKAVRHQLLTEWLRDSRFQAKWNEAVCQLLWEESAR